VFSTDRILLAWVESEFTAGRDPFARADARVREQEPGWHQWSGPGPEVEYGLLVFPWRASLQAASHALPEVVRVLQEAKLEIEDWHSLDEAGVLGAATIGGTLERPLVRRVAQGMERMLALRIMAIAIEVAARDSAQAPQGLESALEDLPASAGRDPVTGGPIGVSVEEGGVRIEASEKTHDYLMRVVGESDSREEELRLQVSR
jgi:hypothetical protein